MHDLRASEKILGSFDVDRLEIETLLFQTGCLTIRETRHMGGMRWFQLGYPNQEVRQSLTDYILSFLTDTTVAQENNKFNLYEALIANNFDALKQTLQGVFSSIPHDWYRRNQGQLRGLLRLHCLLLFCRPGPGCVCVEDSSSHGRIDMTVKLGKHIYIFEFKIVELLAQGRALRQIKDKGYADKYRTPGTTIHLIGVEFSSGISNRVAISSSECPVFLIRKMDRFSISSIFFKAASLAAFSRSLEILSRSLAILSRSLASLSCIRAFSSCFRRASSPCRTRSHSS
ncbi:MAG: PD-(D/E)XK nuclease domain-containing protein [Desulfobacterium sp.]